MAGLKDLQPCPLCRGSACEIVGTRDRDGSALQTTMCVACGHVFTNPPPTQDEMAAYYRDRYRSDYKGVRTPKPKHVLRAGFRALERLERLQAFVPPQARVLDIGAGGGEFVYLLGRAGYEAVGVEPNVGYADHARVAYGIDMCPGTLESARFDAASFDVITLHHVLEHVIDPHGALTRIAAWLKPGGHLIVEVPNVMSWFHAPRRRFHRAHVQTFHAKGLEDLLAGHGFELIDTAITEGPTHINVVACKTGVATQRGFRDCSADVRAHFHRHTEVSHVTSGMALRRVWGNVTRPWREARQLAALGATGPRAILDGLFDAR
ncbi:MAG: methyltransferase domain-containing protein [Rhodospirillaceae bacterium]|nr:methyltransferase domain-containing protein [Rhodospirillaceae bacterium]